MIEVGQESLSALIGDIYQASYDRELWPAVVESLRGVFHGSRACLVRVGPDLQPSDAITANADPTFLNLYLEEFSREPNVLVDAIAAAPVGRVYHDHALVGRNTLRASQFFNEWLAPQDMYGGLVGKLLASGPSIWLIDLQRGRHQAAFDARELALFQLIAPHLRRSVEITRRFQITRALASSFFDLPFGALLVDKNRRVMSMNHAAEAILTRPDGPLRGGSGQLSAADAKTAATLERFVADACSPRDGVARGTGGDFTITTRPRDGGPIVFSVSVGSFVQGEALGVPLEPCAVIIIRETGFALPAGFADHIRALFNLTPREAGLATALAAGRSLKQAAADNGVQFSTARSYLEQIFRKTGVNRQSQLVALLKSVAPIVRRG